MSERFFLLGRAVRVVRTLGVGAPGAGGLARRLEALVWWARALEQHFHALARVRVAAMVGAFVAVVAARVVEPDAQTLCALRGLVEIDRCGRAVAELVHLVVGARVVVEVIAVAIYEPFVAGSFDTRPAGRLVVVQAAVCVLLATPFGRLGEGAALFGITVLTAVALEAIVRAYERLASHASRIRIAGFHTVARVTVVTLQRGTGADAVRADIRCRARVTVVALHLVWLV